MRDDDIEDEDEMIDLSKIQKPSNGQYSKPLSTMHEFYLIGDIESAENYMDWFDTIRHAGEHDIIRIYINSYGGDLFTAIQFLRVLTETAATKIISVEGACMSAATMIFMAADSFEVTPHSVFMFHNYSGGTIGKGGEMIDQLIHERKWSERLLKEIYQDFMADEEIESMLDNKDIWMDGEEVVKRINVKLAARQKAQEKLEKGEKGNHKPAAKKTPKKPSSGQKKAEKGSHNPVL
jgi:ATP-dependent protease ClpP protease subunit